MTEGDETKKIGKGMLIGMWIVLLLLLTMFFGDWLERERNPNRQVQIHQSNEGGRQVVLERNRQGHYVANGRINGQTVTFLLDTGATDIAIPAHLGNELGLERGAPVMFQTANGLAQGYRTRLDSVQLGHITLHDLPASLNPNMQLDEVLLGMSFLKHVEFIQRGDTLILRP